MGDRMQTAILALRSGTSPRGMLQDTGNMRMSLTNSMSFGNSGPKTLDPRALEAALQGSASMPSLPPPQRQVSNSRQSANDDYQRGLIWYLISGTRDSKLIYSNNLPC